MQRRPLPLPGIRDQTVIFFCLLLILCLIPIWSVKVPVLSDYPAHLARMYIISHQHEPLLDKYYAIRWQLIPSLAMDVIVPFLERFTSIFVAGKLFLSFTILLVVSGTFALYYVLHRDWTGPILCFLFVYNGVFMMGIVNYIFSIGAALWATAGWVGLRNRSWMLRLVFSSAAVLVLFFSHLGGIALFGLAIFSYELSRLHRGKFDWREIGRNVAVMAALLILVGLLLSVSPTSHGWSGTSWTAHSKIQGLVWVIKSADLLFDAVFGVIFLGFMVYSVLKGRVELGRFALMFFIVGSVCYLVAPYILAGDGYIDVRLPAAFVFFLIAALRWRFDTPAAALAFNSFVGALVAARVFGVTAAFDGYDKTVSSYEASFAAIKPGSRILVTQDEDAGWRGSGNRTTIEFDQGITSHLPALATIACSCLVSDQFADSGKQILWIRRPYRAAIPPGATEGGLLQVSELETADSGSRQHGYVGDWRSHYDYLYVKYAPAGTRLNLPHLRLIYQGSGFQLYKIPVR
jgi:hypothetical protein